MLEEGRDRIIKTVVLITMGLLISIGVALIIWLMHSVRTELGIGDTVSLMDETSVTYAYAESHLMLMDIS